jgi:hypothetical protein
MGNEADGDGKLLTGHFSGVAVFAQLVRDALCKADAEGWPLMLWSDPNYLDWPLRERAVVESLQRWARGGRRLVILAAQFDDIRRHHPRFVSWRNSWDHIIECRVCTSMDAGEVPSAIWGPNWVMRRLDLVRSTGIAGGEPQSRVLLKEKLEECRRQGRPGFAVTTLGL